MGKGSKRRPTQVSQEKELLQWELAFKKPVHSRRLEILARLNAIDHEEKKAVREGSRQIA